jgi:hypothetical protein
MNVARAGHQATLLLDGRVLVTGWHDNLGMAVAGREDRRARSLADCL